MNKYDELILIVHIDRAQYDTALINHRYRYMQVIYQGILRELSWAPV